MVQLFYMKLNIMKQLCSHKLINKYILLQLPHIKLIIKKQFFKALKADEPIFK